MAEARVIQSRVINYKVWGAFWRGSRKDRSMSEEDFRDLLKREAGISMSKRTLLSVERGERRLSDEELVAFMKVLHPPGMWTKFNEAIRSAFRPAWPR